MSKYTPANMFENLGRSLGRNVVNVKKGLTESGQGLMNILSGERAKRMQPIRRDIQTFTCDDMSISNLCGDLEISDTLKNLIKFYLTKGSCSSLHFLRGKRSVSLYSDRNQIQKISFNDLEFERDIIEECAEKTPFLSYKQLKSFQGKILEIKNRTPRKNNIYFLYYIGLMEAIQENPINRSENSRPPNTNSPRTNEFVKDFFIGYNQMIIHTHTLVEKSPLLRNRLTRTGSRKDISKMLCNQSIVNGIKPETHKSGAPEVEGNSNRPPPSLKDLKLHGPLSNEGEPLPNKGEPLPNEGGPMMGGPRVKRTDSAVSLGGKKKTTRKPSSTKKKTSTKKKSTTSKKKKTTSKK